MLNKCDWGIIRVPNLVKDDPTHTLGYEKWLGEWTDVTKEADPSNLYLCVQILHIMQHFVGTSTETEAWLRGWMGEAVSPRFNGISLRITSKRESIFWFEFPICPPTETKKGYIFPDFHLKKRFLYESVL